MDWLDLRWLPVLPPGDGRASGTLVGEVILDSRWAGPPGFLHGGMAAALLDDCMGGLSHALDRIATITATLDLRFRRPVPLDGTTVRIEAWRESPELRRRNRVHGRLLLCDGAPAVLATALMVSTDQPV